MAATIAHITAVFGSEPAPFQLNVDQDFIDDTYQRVRSARAPVEIQGLSPADTDGPELSIFSKIKGYWVDSYDWRAEEADINKKFTQYTTTVHTPKSKYTQPVPLHFVHHKSSRKDAIPLLFIHGWPGSFLEVGKIIDDLTSPPHSSVPAFHVVAPSIPGFGFSPAPTHDGYGPMEAARSFNALMLQLDYPRYVIQAGDLGGIILRYQASLFSNHVMSALCNFWLTQPTEADYIRFAAKETTSEETQYMARIAGYKNSRSGYRLVHQTTPLALAYAQTDSPMGNLIWLYTTMHRAIDSRHFTFTPAEIITWSMMYYIQGPYGGMRMYKGMASEGTFDILEFGPMPYVEIPIAINEYPGDLWYGLPLEWAQREGNVRKRFVHDRGGHFAAHEVPDLMTKDIREWFGDLYEAGTWVFAGVEVRG